MSLNKSLKVQFSTTRCKYEKGLIVKNDKLMKLKEVREYLGIILSIVKVLIEIVVLLKVLILT